MEKIDVVLGIDVGGTNSVAGLVDYEGNTHLKVSVPTESDKPAEDLFSRLFLIFKESFEKIEDKFNLTGIGVGAPNANYYTGEVDNPPNLKWGKTNIVNLIKEYFDIPVTITNDANAAALGEMEYGIASDFKNFIEITLGTGLGSGIVVNGEVVYGHDGFAGELGHVTVVKDGRECGCGRKGCLENYVSATGIKRTVFDLISKENFESKLKDIPYKTLTSKDIYQAAVNGDKLALKAFDVTGKILGEALANFVAFSSPQAIILFGGLSAAGNLLFEPTKKYMEENLLHVFKGKVKILPSGLPEGDTAILGAAAVTWREIKMKKN